MRSWQGVEVVGGSAEVDLAGNLPGQQARSRAVDEWTRAKSRRPLRAAFARALNLPTEEQRWRRRAESVEMVGKRLNRLTERGWFVLHAVPLGAGDTIDHLVIGPAGVFVVDTRSVNRARLHVSDDAIEVDGRPSDYLVTAQRHAQRTADFLVGHAGLAVPVAPVIVLHAGRGLWPVTWDSAPTSVLVLDRLQVPSWFERLAPVLCDQQVLGVFESARLLSSWS